MDVLKPQLVWIGGRCYRVFESSAWSNERDLPTYVEDDCEAEYEDEECCAPDIEIVPYGTTRFKHTFHVPKAFFPFIIGPKHATRKRLEAETSTAIQIPKVGQDGDIVIIGYHQKGVASARRRIDLIVESSRKKVRPTHFLSVPLNDGHVIMKFNDFKNDVLNNCGASSRGVDDTIFQIPSKLHLTLGMLLLIDETERQKAIEALNHCRETIVKPVLKKYGSMSVRLSGVSVLKGQPDEAGVLCAQVANAEDGLQELADKIIQHFDSIGLLSKSRSDSQGVNLHATFMNTKFKHDEEPAQPVKFDTFDATAVLEAHEETFFGEVQLKQIHISQRHTISSNGYYQATAKIDVTMD